MDHTNLEESTTQVTPLQALKQKADLMGITYSNNISEETLRKRIADKLNAEQADEAAEAASVNAGFEAEAQRRQDEALAGLATSGPHPGLEAQPQHGFLGEGDPKPGGVTTHAAAEASASLAQVAKVSAPQSMAELRRNVDTRPKVRSNTLQQLLRDEQMALVRVRITCMNPHKQDLPGEFHTISNRILGTVRMFIPYGEKTDHGWHIPLVMYNHLKNKTFLQLRFGKPENGMPKVDYNHFPREFAIEVLEPLTPEQIKHIGKAQLAAGTSHVE